MPLSKIGTNAIGTGAVGTADIASGAVTNEKLDNTAQSVGVGQTWQDVLSSRVAGTTYTNSTGKPIMVAVTIRSTTTTGSVASTFYIDGNAVGLATATASNGTSWAPISHCYTFIIPDGSTYSCTAGSSPSISYWQELR